MGGVGPAATVDFMNKIIESTPAEKDQDHIKNDCGAKSADSRPYCKFGS